MQTRLDVHAVHDWRCNLAVLFPVVVTRLDLSLWWNLNNYSTDVIMLLQGSRYRDSAFIGAGHAIKLIRLFLPHDMRCLVIIFLQGDKKK